VIQNGHTIAVNFRPGAGGNFIQNCLGLSRHCVLRDQAYAEWQLSAQVDSAFYQQKLHWALDTIQPGKFSTTWLGHELGSHRLIGFLFSDSRKTTDDDIPQVLHQAAEQGLWVTHTAHNHGWTEHLTRYWPTVRYINVSGEQWAQRWMNVKNHALEWTEWETSPKGYNFDFDAVVESEPAFLKAMQDLYTWLEWTDFEQTPVAEYYRAYKKAHDRQARL
jgi:hypothetical protein